MTVEERKANVSSAISRLAEDCAADFKELCERGELYSGF